jgi:hypothetical protein
VREPLVLSYLSQFEEAERTRRVMEALKVGVVAIQSASPTLDTQVVQEKFVEVEARLKEQVETLAKDMREKLEHYFQERNGVVPRSIKDVFGDKGTLARTLGDFFEPRAGRLVRLLERQVGPSSEFGRLIDPKNKDGIIACVEKTVRELVECKMNDVLTEFSLDDTESAMSHLKRMLENCLGEIKQSLGVEQGRRLEAGRGHVKGLNFEEDLYERIALWGQELGDETEFVRGTPGVLGRKLGDQLITLGDTTGAPGTKIVVESKDQPLRLKDARDELEKAKKNREAVCGIFAFAKGCEPPEVGDFRRIGEDFFCTVDKQFLNSGEPLLYMEAAYKIARAQAVAVIRAEESGTMDLQRVRDHLDALAEWVRQMGEVATKASTVRKNGEAIETAVTTMKKDMEQRINTVLQLLRQDCAD